MSFLAIQENMSTPFCYQNSKVAICIYIVALWTGIIFLSAISNEAFIATTCTETPPLWNVWEGSCLCIGPKELTTIKVMLT